MQLVFYYTFKWFYTKFVNINRTMCKLIGGKIKLSLIVILLVTYIVKLDVDVLVLI